MCTLIADRRRRLRMWVALCEADTWEVVLPSRWLHVYNIMYSYITTFLQIPLENYSLCILGCSKDKFQIRLKANLSSGTVGPCPTRSQQACSWDSPYSIELLPPIGLLHINSSVSLHSILICSSVWETSKVNFYNIKTLDLTMLQ